MSPSARRRGLAFPNLVEITDAGPTFQVFTRRPLVLLALRPRLHFFDHDFGKAIIIGDVEIDLRPFARRQDRARPPGDKNLDSRRFVRLRARKEFPPRPCCRKASSPLE